MNSSSKLIKCQFDSYLKVFSSHVLNCNKVSSNIKKDLKNKISSSSYCVELEDTILFCEGGGQPSDYGTINSIPVSYVGRDSCGLVQHYINSFIEPGTEVEIKLDWNRRFDHMQQHSGQHLLSAIAEQEFGWDTTSWWLGENLCNVEFKITNNDILVSNDTLHKLEERVNTIIRESRNVKAKIISNESLEEQKEESTNPNDRKSSSRHHGDLRVIEIENLDENACCGTHISNTSELQVLKLMGFDKTRGNYRVYFIFGNRVIKNMDNMFQRESQLKNLLSCNPEQSCDMISKLQKDHRILIKSNKALFNEIAEYQANELLNNAEKLNENMIYLLREDGNISFLNTIASNILKKNNDIICILACGNPKGDGQILIQSGKKDISNIGKKVCEYLNGKGGGKGARYQLKVNNLSKFEDIKELLKE